jgi:hypothetical protein
VSNSWRRWHWGKVAARFLCVGGGCLKGGMLGQGKGDGGREVEGVVLGWKRQLSFTMVGGFAVRG